MKIMATKFGYKRDAVRVKAMVISILNLSQTTELVLHYIRCPEVMYQLLMNLIFSES